MKTATALLTIAACYTLLTSPATAQPGQPVPPPPPYASAPAALPPAPGSVPQAHPDIDEGVLKDANSGRTWMSPTALTAPAGTWTFNDYELFFVGGSYALTDQLTVSANTMIPITSDQPTFLFLTGKLQIVRSGNLRLALHGATTYIGDEDDGFTFGAIGGAGSICLDDGCHSLINGYVAAGFSADSNDQSSVPFIFSASLVKAFSNRVKLVLEADSAFVLGEVNEVGEAILGWYGLRFTSSNIGVDVGLVRPFCADCDTDVFPVGFPWVNFTYRGGPTL